MRAMRTAAAALALGGLLAPLFLFAADAAQQAKGGAGKGLPAGDAYWRGEMDRVERDMKPEPYVAPPSRCKRWQGRELVSRYTAGMRESACVSGCAVRLDDVDGSTARWAITGARCAR